ncbi:MAG: NifU family protein [Flavobacteriales bacterium]|nr:NifU family protein [Flavobacteriales bacterium]
MNKKKKIAIIEQALQGLRPFLERDNGDITFVELTNDDVVKVALHGSCKDCSMSMMTLKAGVEERIKNVLPEVQKVIAV